ncbi:MAG: hypothetical protein ACYCVG_12685 [Leptospirillum sp.]
MSLCDRIGTLPSMEKIHFSLVHSKEGYDTQDSSVFRQKWRLTLSCGHVPEKNLRKGYERLWADLRGRCDCQRILF